MLFTRCPECDTTFRVTDETLKKANGQVRCGRCASVFNAYAELYDPTAKSFEAEPKRRVDKPARNAPKPLPAGAAPTDPAAATQTKPADGAESTGGANTTDTSPSVQAISATEVDRVLAVETAAAPESPYEWLRAEDQVPQRSRWWTAAAALALLALGVQVIHHFRSRLAGHATFGPWLTATYEALGSEIAPSWDVHQYQILDWIATAEPNSRGLGSLKITARIQNRGPSSQPYPAVQLRLKDRWEAALGSRMFTPAEYLPRDTPRGRMMSPGETTRAELEVVDPGPDAYGFELDVCIEVEASLVTCGTDEVFL
jgi:predicted Zn finger-like uncharacterized protein